MFLVNFDVVKVITFGDIWRNVRVETITFNSPHVITENNRYDEEIAELKKELAACYREKEENQGSIKRLRSICISQQNIINGQDLDKMTKSAIIKKRNRRRFAR